MVYGKQSLQRGVRKQIALSVTVGLALGAYLIGLSAADLPADWFALLILAITLPAVAVVARDIKRFLLALIMLDMSLSLDAKLFRHPADVSVVVDGLMISLTTISLIILYILWAAEILAANARINLFRSISLPALGFITAGLISVYNAKDPVLSWFELALYCEFFLVFLYLANHIQKPDDIVFVTWVLLAGFLIVSLSVIAMQFIGDVRFMGLGSDTFEMAAVGLVRSGGFLKHPNGAATYLMSLSMVALAILLTNSTTGLGRLIILVALALGFVALILTFSRGGWLSLAVAGTFFALLASHRRWLRWQHLILLVVVLGLFIFLFHEPIWFRIFGDDQGSASSRMPLNIIALNMIRSHPWNGVGINNFMVVVQDYHTPATFGAWLSPVHNKYLLVWSETGTLGILFLIWFYLAICKTALMAWKRGDPTISLLALGFLAAIVGRTAHMSVARFDSRAQGLLLWTFAGIIAAIGNLDGRLKAS